MTTTDALIAAVADCYGWTRNGKPPFIPAGNALSAPTRDAMERLAIGLGATPDAAHSVTDAVLIGIYSRALKSPVAAARAAQGLNAPAPSPYAPAYPSAPVAPPYNDKPVWDELNYLRGYNVTQTDRINALEREVQELRDTAPREVHVQVANVPQVTFTHAHIDLPDIIEQAANRENVWLCGPRGSGKSTAAEQVAQALGLPFYCMTGATDEFAFSGYERPFNGIVTCPQFRSAWIDGGVILLDEMDTFNPAAVVYLNDALANGWCTFPDGRFKKHPDCVVIAGTNTNGLGATEEHSARAVLDGATLDRFSYNYWGYDKALENALSPVPAWTRYVQALRAEFERQSIPHAPSPRASINGGKRIVRTGNWTKAAESYIWRGMAPDVRKRLERAVPMADYFEPAQAANLAA